MPAPSFTVEPARLEELARTVGQRAADLRGAGGRFRGPALDVGDAFGWLGPSPDVLRDYLELAQGTHEALGQLDATLERIARSLRATATAYRSAEVANVVAG